MTSKDIVTILKECKGLHIKKLELGDLKLTFGDLTPVEDQSFIDANLTQSLPLSEPVEHSNEEIDLIAKDYELGLLAAHDPEAYEEKLRMA